MLLIIFSFLFSSYLFCGGINSTENRQDLAAIAEKISINDYLRTMQQYEKDMDKDYGVIHYLCYQTMKEHFLGKESRHISNPSVSCSLVAKGICYKKQEEVKFKEFFIDDYLPSLSKQFLRCKPHSW